MIYELGENVLFLSGDAEFAHHVTEKGDGLYIGEVIEIFENSLRLSYMCLKEKILLSICVPFSAVKRPETQTQWDDFYALYDNVLNRFRGDV